MCDAASEATPPSRTMAPRQTSGSVDLRDLAQQRRVVVRGHSPRAFCLGISTIVSPGARDDAEGLRQVAVPGGLLRASPPATRPRAAHDSETERLLFGTGLSRLTCS